MENPKLHSRPTEPSLHLHTIPRSSVSGSVSPHGGALGLWDSIQKTDSSAGAYTDVRDEFRGQLVCQAGDCGPSFLQEDPADREEKTMTTSTLVWPENASQLSAAGKVK